MTNNQTPIVKRTINQPVSSTLQQLKKERHESGSSSISSNSGKGTPEKTRKMAILAGKSEALARVANYSSDEDTQQQQQHVQVTVATKKKDQEDELMVSYKKRQEQKRKRKYNSEGSFWGIGKVIFQKMFKIF